MSKKILLVGGAGFIGHHLALELRRQNNEVLIVDNLKINNIVQAIEEQRKDLYLKFLLDRFNLLKKAGIEIKTSDARNFHKLSLIVSEFKPDVIVHLAAISHAGKGNKDPYSTFDNGLRTLENALDASREVEHFIYFSSSMVYGNFERKFVKEDDNLRPMGIYGLLKKQGEEIVREYHKLFGLPYTIIRPSALYGPRCISRRVIQIFIENLMESKNLTISGDGKEKLDFTYIDDLVSGVCLVINHKEKSRNETFNITYGKSESILNVAEYLKGLFDVRSDKICVSEIEFEERDRRMPYRGTLSVEKAGRLLGYSPMNDIQKGVDKYVNWYRSQR